MNNFNIETFINVDYLTDFRKDRKRKTQEVFTPYIIVKKLMDNVSNEDWGDYNKTFLDPAGGNGNIILGIIYRRIVEYNIPWDITLKNCYSVELMEDNVQECKERILNLLDALQIKYDKELALQIMDRNLICHDFFTWNFKEWRPYTEEELKKLKIKTKGTTK